MQVISCPNLGFDQRGVRCVLYRTPRPREYMPGGATLDILNGPLLPVRMAN